MTEPNDELGAYLSAIQGTLTEMAEKNLITASPRHVARVVTLLLGNAADLMVAVGCPTYKWVGLCAKTFAASEKGMAEAAAVLAAKKATLS